jgi:hypothetical protein
VSRTRPAASDCVGEIVPDAFSRGNRLFALQPTAIASHFAGADLANCSTAEQTIELLLGDAVALARALYQALAIDDRDVATSIAGEAGGQELLREQKPHPTACCRASSTASGNIAAVGE